MTYRGYTLEQIASHIDHSVLKPESSRAEIVRAAAVARQFKTASLCIRPMDVKLAVAELAGSGVPVCTVIGFPHGTSTTAAKVTERYTLQRPWLGLIGRSAFMAPPSGRRDG